MNTCEPDLIISSDLELISSVCDQTVQFYLSFVDVVMDFNPFPIIYEQTVTYFEFSDGTASVMP